MHCAKIRVFTVIKFGAKHYGTKDIMKSHLIFYDLKQSKPLNFLFERSLNFRINLWNHHFSQNMNKKLSGFLPCSVLHYTGQKSWQFFVHILGEKLTSQIHSEIYWPLQSTNEWKKQIMELKKWNKLHHCAQVITEE